MVTHVEGRHRSPESPSLGDGTFFPLKTQGLFGLVLSGPQWCLKITFSGQNQNLFTDDASDEYHQFFVIFVRTLNYAQSQGPFITPGCRDS